MSGAMWFCTVGEHRNSVISGHFARLRSLDAVPLLLNQSLFRQTLVLDARQSQVLRARRFLNPSCIRPTGIVLS